MLPLIFVSRARQAEGALARKLVHVAAEDRFSSYLVDWHVGNR